MPFDSIYLLYGAVFLGALLLFEGLYFLYVDTRGGRDAVNRRMRMLASSDSSREVFETLRRKRRQSFEPLGALGDILPRFDHLIQQAGLTITLPRMLMIMSALSVCAFFGILIAVRNWGIALGGPSIIFAVVAALVAGFAVPVFAVRYLKERRLKLFAEQLPDALDVMVRSLHAGHPVSAAMALVTKEMPDPIGTEFGIAVDEMTYGLDLREALASLADRIDLEDFQYVVVAMNIQHETGGNLAEVLHGLSTVIRARFRMFKKIRALSAEGRLSAKILAILPIIFGFITFNGKPDYYLDAMPDPLFLPMFGVAIGLEIIGIVIMYKLVNFRV